MDVHGDFVTKNFLDAEITHFITSIATNMLSAKTSRELRNSGICDPSINTSTRYKSLFQIPTSMSESSLRVIVLPSLVYPYFKLGLRQDEIRKVLLIRQVTE